MNYRILTGDSSGGRRRRRDDDITLHEDFEPGIKFTCKYQRIIDVESSTSAVGETETVEDNVPTKMGFLEYTGRLSKLFQIT